MLFFRLLRLFQDVRPAFERAEGVVAICAFVKKCAKIVLFFYICVKSTPQYVIFVVCMAALSVRNSVCRWRSDRCENQWFPSLLMLTHRLDVHAFVKKLYLCPILQKWIYMKKVLFFLLCLTGIQSVVSAQCWPLVSEPDEYEVKSAGSVNHDKIISWSGDASNLSFDFFTGVGTSGTRYVYAYESSDCSGEAHELMSISCWAWSISQGTWLENYCNIDISDQNYHSIKITGASSVGLAKIRNLLVTRRGNYIDVDDEVLDFDSVEIGYNEALPLVVRHNIESGQITISSSNPALFTPSVSVITSENGCQTGFAVLFAPTDSGRYAADLTITDGTITKTIALQGSGHRHPQHVEWNGRHTLSVGDALTPIATVPSGLPLRFEAADNASFVLQGDSLIAIAEGEALIYAMQDGDDVYAPVRDSMVFIVTQLEVQTITWEQDLMRFSVGDEPVGLNAASSVGMPVNYASSNEAVVRIAGDSLYVVGAGEAIVTAYAEGNDIYTSAEASRLIVVRSVDETCSGIALYDESSHSMSSGSFTVALAAPGEVLSFRLYLPGSTTGTLTITDDLGNRVLSINSLYSLSDTFTGKWLTYSDIAISHEARSLTFSLTGTLSKTINNIYVPQASFLETNRPNIEINTLVNNLYDGQFDVSYSNLPNSVYVVNSNPKLQLLNADDFGSGCASFGVQTIDYHYTSDIDTAEEDTIIVSDGISTLRIPVAIRVARKIQSIEWSQDLSATRIIDTIPLTASASSGLPVTYAVSDTTVAVIDSLDRLCFIGEGSVTISAIQLGNKEYEPTQTFNKVVRVERITPEIIIAPSTATIGLGESLERASFEGGETSVDGTFVWADPTIVPELGTQDFDAVFVPDNPAFYNSLELQVSVTVDSVAPPRVTVNVYPTADDLRYGQTLEQSSLTGGMASAAGTFAWATPDITPDAGYQEFEVVFTADSAALGSTSIMVSIYIEQAPQTITWDQTLDSVLVGDSVRLTAYSSMMFDIIYEVSDSSVARVYGDTLVALQPGVITLTATQPGTINFQAAEGIAMYVVIYEKAPDDEEPPVDNSIARVIKSGNVRIDNLAHLLVIDMAGLRDVCLYDAAGRLVKSVSGSSSAITLDVPTGIYMLRIRTQDATYAGKIRI